MSETEVVYAVLEALERHPLVAWAQRRNTGGAVFSGRYVAFGDEGDADISGQLADGRRLEVEVKKPGEWPPAALFAKWEAIAPAKRNRNQRRLLAQRDFLEKVRAANGVGFVATSVPDLYEALGEPGKALDGLDPERYRRALVEAATAGAGKRRRRRSRWMALPAGLGE